MKKMLLLRSVTKRARQYADRHFRYFKFFNSPEEAVKSLSQGERPSFVIVDAGTGMRSAGLNSKAMRWGYVVETKGVA